jgi:hypothetical protein
MSNALTESSQTIKKKKKDYKTAASANTNSTSTTSTSSASNGNSNSNSSSSSSSSSSRSVSREADSPDGSDLDYAYNLFALVRHQGSLSGMPSFVCDAHQAQLLMNSHHHQAGTT